MNIKFSTYSKKSGLQQLIVRLYYGRFDLSVKLDLFVAESDWNEALQLTNSSNLVNEKLLKLKSEILAKYNEDYVRGVLVNKQWLSEIVSNVFNRPSEEKKLINSDASIYLVEFANEWLKTKSGSWKVSHSKVMNKILKGQYQNTVDLLAEFEGFANYKITLKDLKTEDIYSFIEYLQQELNYNISTIERIIGRLKFFLNRAEEFGIKVSKSYKQRIYIDKYDDEIESVVFSEQELQLLHNRQEWKSDLYSEEDLENAKDNLILSCYTSLRISDFMQGLDISKIKDNRILIRTKKTNQFTRIPLHRFLVDILNKRFYQLPKKFDNHTYNLLIKEVCKIAGINQITYGSLWDADKKRKIKGYFPKYAFVSSHIGRKSFISNLKGKVSDDLLMSIGAWKSKDMMAHYDKTTKEDYAEQLSSFWLSQN